MNHLTGVTELRNRYFLMRHGQSRANAAKIIVSSPASDGDGDYGLTALGREQARTAAARSGLPTDTVIISSGFARARETAEIVRGYLKAPPVTLADALRERFFGDFDGTSTASYETVWAADQAGRTEGDVEPPAAVLDRATALVAALDREHDGRDVLLVSHGDVLQILQVGFLRLNPRLHRGVRHLRTAEIRPVSLARAPAYSDGKADLISELLRLARG